MKRHQWEKFHSAPVPPLPARPASSEVAIADPLAGSGDAFRNFTGSKAGAGVWQTILNQIPPHDTFIEAFAGTAAVTRHKRPAPGTIVIDSDAAVAARLKASLPAAVTVICDDAVRWLKAHLGEFGEQTVIYADPPYLFSARDGGTRTRYGNEFGTEEQHWALLGALDRCGQAGAQVLVSGYRSELYDRVLRRWRRVDYRCQTRGGPRVECLWCNFDAPAKLAEYTVAGANFRERERLKRKKARWLGKLEKMPALDRAAVLAAIDEWRRQSSST